MTPFLRHALAAPLLAAALAAVDADPGAAQLLPQVGATAEVQEEPASEADSGAPTADGGRTGDASPAHGSAAE